MNKRIKKKYLTALRINKCIPAFQKFKHLIKGKSFYFFGRRSDVMSIYIAFNRKSLKKDLREFKNDLKEMNE